MLYRIFPYESGKMNEWHKTQWRECNTAKPAAANGEWRVENIYFYANPASRVSTLDCGRLSLCWFWFDLYTSFFSFCIVLFCPWMSILYRRYWEFDFIQLFIKIYVLWWKWPYTVRIFVFKSHPFHLRFDSRKQNYTTAYSQHGDN